MILPSTNLRIKPPPIEIIDDYIRLAAGFLKEVCKTLKAGAIAANQVGLNLRMFVYNNETFINPEIIEASVAQDVAKEACLSLPNVSKMISRSKFMCVSYYDERGLLRKKTFYILDARFIQHEIDHLNGILIEDYND